MIKTLANYYYLDLLDRFQLYSCVARVAHLCPFNSMKQMTQTNFRLSCAQCKRPLPTDTPRLSSTCAKCQNAVLTCIIWYVSNQHTHTHYNICSHTCVRGLFIWCRGCAHGGHLNHMNVSHPHSFFTTHPSGMVFHPRHMSNRLWSFMFCNNIFNATDGTTIVAYI
jgi:hypothetical protein